VITRVGVVGLGLIGGSLLRRLEVTAGGMTRATGWDADAHTRVRVATAGLSVSTSLEELAAVSEVIFVAVPLPELSSVFAGIASLVDPAAVVTDLTSVKQPVRDLAATYDFTFVGGHPMAGSERSGFPASTSDLFADAAWVLTLDDGTDVAAWLEVAELITSLGCRVVPCTSAEHDRAVARVSHLPHVVAAALTIGAADDPLALALAAGSFRDATRVAGTRPELIAAMCGGNAAAVDAELKAFVTRLQEAQLLLRDPKRLAAWFAAAGSVRKEWPPVANGQTGLVIDEHLPARLLAAGRAGRQVTSINAGYVMVAMPSTDMPSTN